MRNVYLYPVFEDKASFDDVMGRAAWYFEPWLNDIKGFHVGTAFEAATAVAPDPKLDPRVAAKAPALLQRAVIHNTAATTNASLAQEAKKNAELLLIWKMPGDPEQRAQAQSLYDAVRARGWLSYVVDKDNEMSHGCNWLWSSITLASREERERLKADSYAALMRFASQVRSPRAYVLGTGPNLEQAAGRDFSDGDCIIANSIIKNRPLMKRLDPIAVCACDPIFHAGVSLYAAEFRETLIEAMDDFPRMFFFAPHRDEKIYLLNLPQRLHDRLIFTPIDTSPGVKWNFDLRRDFYLVPEGNVLTQMMLPIAAAFHEKISIIGCDGRPLSQNTYFWSHHKSSQFNDQMQNIQEVHPAFFKLRDYDDHYAEHCADVARIIGNLEEAGKRVECLTDSYLPALRQRYSLDQRPLGDDVVVVSLNPNLRNNYGHLLGYDEGLREAARASGAHFLTLGSVNFHGAHADLDGAEILIEPAFSDNVYAALTRKLADVDQAAVLNFEREFETAVVRHKREHAGKRLAYYLYMGSLPHAVAVASVCARHPEIAATVNTFGECIMDCVRDGHIDQWTAFLQSAAQQANFAVLAITPQLLRDVRTRCGVDLRLCPHPTAAFPDALFAAWIKQLERAPLPLQPNRLVFPGGFWGEKNFDLTCDIARDAAAKGYACAVRTGPLESANRQQLEARRAIAPFARTADGVLSDEDYRALFHDADIAVLTYRRADWRMRNSSVVVDCLYAGLPMVVVSGTWLSDLVEKFGCGEVVQEETAGAFMAAVERIRAAYPSYRKRTIAAARTYQNANSFADVLAAAVSPLWRDPDEPFAAYQPQTIPAALDAMRTAAIKAAPMESPQMPFDTPSIGRSGALEFALSREANCMFEELSVARALLADRAQGECVMIDVGAHSGGSFPPFIDAGWTVHAFEPDPSNRAGIPKRYLDNPRFILDPRALSNKVQHDVAFFTSTESTGISGLSAFHNTHVETTRVSTTTLAHVIADRGIDHITLLKVDTEGFDLFVLQGMAWDRVLPEIVITEYENNKTEKLGYTFEDQIRLLEQHGYTVFVSEWWPIVRYGIRHHWRSLYPAAQKRPPTASWGNLIAFRRPPPLKQIYRAMLEAIDLPRDPETLSQAKRELGALQAGVEAMTSAASAPPPLAHPQSRPETGFAAWLRARTTPGRAALARAVGLWGLGTLALTFASTWAWTTPGAAAWLRGATSGAAVAAWLGVLVAAVAVLAFLQRRAIVDRLAGEPTLLGILTTLNALQRRRRREAMVSAGLLAGLALISGAVLGAGATGAVSAWVFVPLLALLAGAGLGLTAAWALALTLALIRRESEGAMARKYDRTLAFLQSDVAAQTNAQAAALADLNARLDAGRAEYTAQNARLNALSSNLEANRAEAAGAQKAQAEATHALVAREVLTTQKIQADASVALARRLTLEMSDLQYTTAAALAAVYARVGEILTSADNDRLAMQGAASSQTDAIDALAMKVGEIASAFDLIKSETEHLRTNFAEAKKTLDARVTNVAADLALETNKRFDRFRRAIAELDDEFRGEMLNRVHALRQDFELGVHRRAEAARSAAVAEAEALIEDAERNWRASAERATAEQSAHALAAAAQVEELRLALRQHTESAGAELAAATEASEGRAALRLAALRQDVETVLRQHAETIEAARQEMQRSSAELAGIGAHFKASEQETGIRLAKQIDDLRSAMDGAIAQQAEAARSSATEEAAALAKEVELRMSSQLHELRDNIDDAFRQHANAVRAAAVAESAQAAATSESRISARIDDVQHAQETAVGLASAIEQRLMARVEGVSETLQATINEQIAAVRAAVALGSESEQRLAARVASLGESLQAALNDQIAAVRAAFVAEDARLLTTTEALAEQQARRLSPNASRFLNFNRRLTDESVAQLQKWAAKLGVKRDSGALAYMAHRIENMEAVARGRLAASTETQILRNLVALSVRTEKFEALEIGTLYGLGAAALIEAAQSRFPATRLTIIDPFEGYYNEARDPLLGLPISRAGFEANMHRLEVAADSYRVIEGFSEEEASIEAARGARYQFLLIDGDHSYEGVRRDFENYAPMVDRYGYVLIDDYEVAEYEGIQQYVDETLKRDERLQFVGAAFSTAVFRIWRKFSA
jgi:FkbM family methyltransferase